MTNHYMEVIDMSQRTCSIDGCERIHHAKGYCGAHYRRVLDGRDLDAPMVRNTRPVKQCSIEDCDSQTVSYGWCRVHYLRWRKYGDPQVYHWQHYDNPEQSFADNTEPQGDCLIWVGAISSSGYGVISGGGTRESAHRWAYEQANGPIPTGQTIDHTCGVRACVDPAHLRVATYKQNNENWITPLQRNNTSGARNVLWEKRSQRWVVRVMHNRRSHHGGTYESLADAEASAQALRNRLHTYNDRDRVA